MQMFMDRMKIVIIEDNEKFRAVLDFLFSIKNTYEVIALLTHADASKNKILEKANIAIVAVKSTEQKTLETVRFIKEAYSLKTLALPLHIQDALVDELKSMKVDGILSKNRIDQDKVYQALDQISKEGNYFDLTG
jgi:DNA-binding NarL/FixJ family response regulator